MWTTGSGVHLTLGFVFAAKRKKPQGDPRTEIALWKRLRVTDDLHRYQQSPIIRPNQSSLPRFPAWVAVLLLPTLDLVRTAPRRARVGCLRPRRVPALCAPTSSLLLCSIDSKLPFSPAELTESARRDFAAFYAVAAEHEAQMMDSLVLTLAAVTIGVNTPRAGVDGNTRRALEKTTDQTELLFMQLCDAVRGCQAFKALLPREQALIERVAMTVKSTDSEI